MRIINSTVLLKLFMKSLKILNINVHIRGYFLLNILFTVLHVEGYIYLLAKSDHSLIAHEGLQNDSTVSPNSYG